MEKVAEMVKAWLGMQVSGRTGGVLVMKGAGRVRSMVCVGEMQLSGRTGGVLVMKGVVRVSSMVWVGENQLGERTSEVVVMKGAMRVSSTVWVGWKGGAKPDSRMRGTMK